MSEQPYGDQPGHFSDELPPSDLAGGPRPFGWLFGLGLITLAGAGLAWTAHVPDIHQPRVIAVMLALGLGWWLAMCIARHQEWHVRAYALAAGVGLACMAWCLVPTTAGLSLWTAWQTYQGFAAELAALAPGDLDSYRQGKSARKSLVEQFPEYRELVEQAEKDWCERSAPRWLDSVEQLPPADLAAFAATRQAYEEFLSDRLRAAEEAWFENTYASLSPGDFAAAVQVRDLAQATDHWGGPLQGAEAQWVRRTADAVIAAEQPRIAAAPQEASARLRQTAARVAAFGTFADAQQQLLAARRQAAAAWLDAGRRQGKAMIAEDRFDAAAEAAQRLEQAMQPEAEAIGLVDELVRFRDGYAFLAELARLAHPADETR